MLWTPPWGTKDQSKSMSNYVKKKSIKSTKTAKTAKAESQFHHLISHTSCPKDFADKDKTPHFLTIWVFLAQTWGRWLSLGDDELPSHMHRLVQLNPPQYLTFYLSFWNYVLPPNCIYVTPFFVSMYTFPFKTECIWNIKSFSLKILSNKVKAKTFPYVCFNHS